MTLYNQIQLTYKLPDFDVVLKFMNKNKKRHKWNTKLKCIETVKYKYVNKKRYIRKTYSFRAQF